MSVTEAAIRLESVRVAFDGRTALEDLTIDLEHRRIGVIGANGSGKSTFARLLNGLVTADAGTVSVHGLDPGRDGRLLRRTAGFVFSNPDVQIVMPTVAEDVAFSLRGHGLSRGEVDERVTEILERLGLAPLRDLPAFALSGGQKQLLALAAVLVSRPSLVIADEPTALLDATNSRTISGHLLDDPPHQVVLVTHDLQLAARCDIVLLFDRARLVDAGDPDSVIAAYERQHA